MKGLKVAIALLLVGAVLLVSFGCGKSGAATPTATQTVTAKMGDISIMVTGTGNLALSKTEDVSFEMAGTVKEVLVSVGDSVALGKELANLDTTDRDKQVKTLQNSLENAQRNLDTNKTAVTKAESNVTKAESNVTKAESNVTKAQSGVAKAQDGVTNAENAVTKAVSNKTKAERQVAVKELAVQQAELDLQAVRNNFSSITEVKSAQDAVDKAQYELDLARNSQLGAATRGDSAEAEFWRQQIKYYEGGLASAKKDLQDILSGTSARLSGDAALQLAKAQLQVKQSEMALEDAHTAVTDAQKAVIDAQTAIDNAKEGVADAQDGVKEAQDAVMEAQDAVSDAQNAVNDAKTGVVNAQYNLKQAEEAVADAQEGLAEAQASNPVIKAPFAGLITSVKINAGDQIQKGKAAVTIADPSQFQANIMVNENDIFSLKLDGDANVEVDALSGLTFPAKITAIAPTATVQQGVVNYQVTVALTSARPTTGGLASANGSAFPGLRPGATGIPSGGQVTNLPPGFTPGAGASGRTFPSGIPGGAGGQVTGNFTDRAFGGLGQAAQSQNTVLKAGLSVTVNVIIQQKTGVLTVPSRAITRQGGKTTVEKVNGASTETVNVKTGMTDGTNTEITEGLQQNDQVLVKTSTSSGTSSGRGGVQFGGPGGAIRIP